MYQLTREQLLKDLHQAFKDASKHKRNKSYVKRFAKNLDKNLEELCDELWERRYAARACQRFVVFYPKVREVFAADFRDRIVHHLYYNYTHELYERTFIQDTYSCIPERGTHYGIDRLEQHIRQESLNYSEVCYVLKLDISGYFMHIQRERLLEIALDSLKQMSRHRILKRVPVRWGDRLDMDFLEYMTREITLLDPAENCYIMGDPANLDMVPFGKKITDVPKGCGLPIGNLTSQEFSNVYLNLLDQYIKQELKCKHYGRYVDDLYIVSCDKKWLLSLVPKIEKFLQDMLGLSLQKGKTRIYKVQEGVPFLGAFLKPGRRYIENKSLHNMYVKMDEMVKNLPSNPMERAERLNASLNSYMGVLGHYHSYNIRRDMMNRYGLSDFGIFSLDMKKFRAFEPLRLPEVSIEDFHFEFEKEDWGLNLDIDFDPTDLDSYLNVDTSDWEEVSWNDLDLVEVR